MEILNYFIFITLVLPLTACDKGINKNEDEAIDKKEITIPTPLIDFDGATYRGIQGGLYPNESNQRPYAHNNAGIEISKSIRPLNESGIEDPANGKIVWMSVGMSNTTQETSVFIDQMKTFTDKHPKLVLIDGAQGGQDINKINNPEAPYWDAVNTRLANSGLIPSQVQIIWFKEAEAGPSDTSFVTYPNALKMKYRSVMKMLKSKFTNLKIVYLSNRIYAGYATTKLNPEPFAWYTGWAIKKLIEEQINGDNELSFAGANPNAAWLSWGPYLWADGTAPRSDGLYWVRDDFQADGTHPSMSGRKKVADLLINFFSTDETAKYWFLAP
jgi:hypothetical protein